MQKTSLENQATGRICSFYVLYTYSSMNRRPFFRIVDLHAHCYEDDMWKLMKVDQR